MNLLPSEPPLNKLCQYCQSRIKPSEDSFNCPACGSHYHTECWSEGGGCSVYGCSEKGSFHGKFATEQKTIKEQLVHIEYLINKRKFTDAMNECSRILNADGSNVDAKELFNKCTSYLNTRIKLLESADEAFSKKDFKSASIFYKNYLKYCDEIEYDFVSSKLRFIDERIPQIKKQKFLLSMVYTALSFAILATIILSVYYFVFLNEEREFSEIRRGESVESVRDIEVYINKYERFLDKYEDGKMSDKAKERITSLSDLLIRKIYRDDWKTALTFLNKIDKNNAPKTYNDLFQLVYGRASEEFQSVILKAKNLDKNKKYSEAKAEIDKAMYILRYFPDTEIERKKQVLADNKNLLSKKLTLLIKYDNIESEIKKKTEELKEYGDIKNPDIVNIRARIIKKYGNRTYIARDAVTKKLMALKLDDGAYSLGEEISFDCTLNGKINVEDDYGNEIILPLYTKSEYYPDSYPDYEKESILQRLNYLKSEKIKIDSVLKLGI